MRQTTAKVKCMKRVEMTYATIKKAEGDTDDKTNAK